MVWLPCCWAALVSPEAAFLRRGARLRQHPRRTAPADGQLRLPTAQASTDCAQLTVVWPHNPNQLRPAARGSPVFSELVDASPTSLCLIFFTLQFHHKAAKAGIAIAASAQTVKLFVAATRRIRAAFRRGARISIAGCSRREAQPKAINSSTVLLARRTVVDGASKRQRGRRRRTVAVRPTS